MDAPPRAWEVGQAPYEPSYGHLQAPDAAVAQDRALRQLYVAIGDPGLIEVFDIDRLKRVDVVETERGAHTIGLDPDRHRVYAFLPATHRAAVLAAEA